MKDVPSTTPKQLADAVDIARQSGLKWVSPTPQEIGALTRFVAQRQEV
jgi:hypothetical protein